MKTKTESGRVVEVQDGDLLEANEPVFLPSVVSAAGEYIEIKAVLGCEFYVWAQPGEKIGGTEKILLGKHQRFVRLFADTANSMWRIK